MKFSLNDVSGTNNSTFVMSRLNSTSDCFLKFNPFWLFDNLKLFNSAVGASVLTPSIVSWNGGITEV